MSPVGKLADQLIVTYQRRISPRKGWRCAHGALHGGQPCSAAVRDTLARRGVVRGVWPTALRFVACYQAARMLAATEVRGVCCCGGIPIPFGFSRPRRG